MSSNQLVSNRISLLQAELAALNKAKADEAVEQKKQRLWISAKTLPDASTKRAIVWCGDQMKLAWFLDGQWYEYDGTWLLKTKDILSGVSHWMGTDWMTTSWWPAYGPGPMNRLRYWWSKATGSAMAMAAVMRPKAFGGNAQLSRKVVFYKNSAGEVLTGMPENIPTPRGYEKVVCNNVFEAERWSERQRQWDNLKHGRIQEQREITEGAIRDEIRKEMHHNMANARNNINREFLRRALERDAQREAPWKYARESYLHAEGFEDRH